MDNIYKNIEEYNPTNKRKILIALDHVITGILSNKKFNSIVTKLFIRDRKLNISLVFITQSYFKVQKDVRQNTTHILFWKSHIKENFNKLHLVIHKILTLKNS